MKPYKELRKHLNKNFNHDNLSNEYNVMGAIQLWVEQSGITCTKRHLIILCDIMGGTLYPYQKRDRKMIHKYLKENKKWVKR